METTPDTGAVADSAGPAQRILFVIDHFRDPHAGTEGQLFHLVQGLDRRRFDPLLLVFSDSEYLQSGGFPCPYQVLGHRKLSSPATWKALWRKAARLKAEGYALAHVFFNDASVLCPPVFRLRGIRTLISRRDMGYWYTPGYRLLLRLTGRFVTGVIANSQAVKDVTAQQEKLPPERIHVIYNGYDHGDIPPGVSALPVTIREPDAVLVGLVANIRPIKRIGDAVEAIIRLRENQPPVHLVVIGSGDTRALQDQASQGGVADRVHFLGQRQDVKNCLRGMHIGLLCSESEGFSNALIEYMQAGLAVVCTRAGGNPEAIEPGRHGLLYPVGDWQSLAHCLSSLANDAQLRQRLGQNALASARERFTMEAMVAAHETLYRQLRLPCTGS
ncbi:MAG: glycosyltransferase [Oleiphilaceae bacterium]|nr:glycosyltransferase [Oleiphilaceae bacterium]